MLPLREALVDCALAVGESEVWVEQRTPEGILMGRKESGHPRTQSQPV